MLGGKSVPGVEQGAATPQLFIPRLIQMYRAGASPFDRLACFYGFARINQAAADFQSGAVIKPVLRMA